MCLFSYSFYICIYLTPSWSPNSCSFEGVWSAVWSTFSHGVQLVLDNFRITESLRLEESSEVMESKLWLSLHHVEQSSVCHVWPVLEQGWCLHHLPWQSQAMLNNLCHEQTPYVQPEPGVATPSKAFLFTDISFLVHFSLFFHFPFSW